MHLCVFILYLLCTILSLQAQGIPSLSIPSGDALTLDGNTQVVLPEFLFGGPFSVEAWVLANFNSTTDTPGPLLYFGNENDADKVEIGIDAGGYLYLELGVSDKTAFQEQIPTDPAVLSHITPFLTTPLADAYGSGPLVRRVQFQIPVSFSGQWILLDIKETSSGVITFFINRVQVFQTSTLDLPVLPMYLFRTYNLIGANPSQKFLGNLQVITLWGRPLANNDIISGNTVKLNDGGLIGRWDFSFVVNGVVLNQAADAKATISKATQDIERQLGALQQQLDTAQASYTANPSPATLLVLNEAQAAIDQAKKLPNTQGVVSSDKGFKSTAQVDLINSIRAQANSGSGDPAAIAAQVQLYAQATRDHTTNTANDLATIASAFTQDTDVWLNAALNGLNKLPYRATSANARSLLQTNQLAQTTTVRNSASIDDRLDGIIVQEGSRKRGADTQATRQCNTPTFDLSCTWCNDPHFTLRTANYSGRTGFSIAFDYMSPTCHWILLSGDVMIQEQSYKCNGAAGCITSVGAFIANQYVVILSNDNSISVNGKKITCLPYTIDCDKGLYIQKTSTYGNTLVTPDFQLGLSGGSSASLLFTSDEYWNADPHSICVNKINQPGKALSPAYYDVIGPNQCFLDLKNWQPNTTAICPKCQNGGTADFTLADGCHCDCQDGWKGDVCDTFYCQECASSGTCTGPNQCTCAVNDPVYIFGGSDCSAKCERAKCQNGGTVVMNADTSCSCDCPYGWWGDDCQNPLCAVGPNGKLCSGYGACETNGTCTCIHDVSFGTDCSGNCSAQICASANGQVCGGHGYCECGACMCDRDFGGPACNLPDCTNVTSTPDPNGCGSNGVCMGDQSVPYCQCNPGWEGDRCDSFFCTDCSSEHGTCTKAPLPFCTCDKGWTSASCSEFTCDFLSNCTTPKGQCVYNASFGDMPKCACGPYWTGDDCTTAICPNACSKQGTCVNSPAGSADPPVCQCDPPWIGDDCSKLPDCDPATDGELWSSPEWEARATSICYNASFIDPIHNTSCIIDAQSMDNYEILFSLAYQKYQNCKLDESNGGPACGTLCPNFCSFNGLCEFNGTCTCDPGFFGLDCSLQVNRRAYLVEYDGGQERSEINQVVLPAAPATHLAISAGATHTTNEVAGAAVVYLYQDYRPLFGECKPYNNLYLIVLLDQATSSCTSGRTYKFSVTSTDDAIPLVLGNQCTAQQTAATTTTFSCSWTIGTNAAVVAGPLSQNTSWTLNFGLPTSDTDCISSLYYASESLTGITDLTPVPPAQASDFTIVSEMSNSQCGTITDCGSCMAAAGCGWCPDIGYCMEGTASGPTLGMCSVWRYSNDEQDSRVIGSSGFYLNVVPSNIEVYLTPGSQIEIPVSVIVPKQPAIQVQFLVDLSAGMTPVVNTLSAQASTLFSSLVAAYPSSEVAVASFIDKPVEPYGENVTGDYVYYSKQLMSSDASQFEDTVSGLLIGNGGDIPNAQLEALLQAALRSTGTGFTGPQNFVVMITGTPYHIPPTNFSMPNNLDTTTDINEDYPTIAEVRTALINANIAPVFVVTDSAWYPNYTALVEQLGFGYAIQATALDLVTPTMNGLAHALSSITLQGTSTQYVSSIYPESYASIQPLSRVHFFVTLDRSATKRYELFDATLTLAAPGFGTVTFNLSSSDVPVGDNQLVQIKENTQVVITLGGDNVYHTDLTRTIASLPVGGILIQYDSKEIISTVGTEVTDPNNRVIYVPNVNGSCSYIPGEYCSRRRHVCTPCPYDSFSYSLVDGCACRSTNITVTLDVLANVVNNRPTASMTQQPSTLEDTALPITLTGSDPDNDTLWTIVTSLPTRGQLYEGSTNITQAMLPYNATSHVVTYVPPFHRWGDDFDSFTYYVNDGHAAYELGNSAPFTVSINVILTDNPPVVYNLSFVALENNNVLITLQVSDDKTDFDNGWIHVFILDFPNATQGTLQNIDGTQITETTNYVTDTVKWQLIFVPTLYAHGTPLFTFRYRAYDTQLYSDDAFVQVNITFVNQLPINLTPESITVLEDTPYNITFSCFDPEGDTIAWTIISPPTTGSLVDVVGGNKKLARKSVLASTWAVYTPPKDSTQLTAFTYYPNDRPGSTVVTATDQMTIFITAVNDPPTIAATTTNFPTAVAKSGSTTVVVNNITVADVDVDLNFMTVNISLTGSGSITLTPPNPDVLQNFTESSNFITFSARLPDINTLFKSALTYTIQDTLGQPSYLGTIFISITDNGFVGEGGAGYANVTIQVQTTVSASAHTSLALSLGALGVGVASAAGIGGVYKVLKYKNVFGEESDPFANMGDEQVDVVMENPLYQPSPRNSLQ